MHLLLLVWTLTCLIMPNEAIIGYDCGGPAAEVTTISTIDVAPCPFSDIPKKAEVTEKNIQLVQYNTFKFVDVIQCKISVSRTIYHCSNNKLFFFLPITQPLLFLKWADEMPEGYRSFIYDIPERECIEIHKKGSVTLSGLNNYFLEKIEVNNNIETEQTVRLSGWMDRDTELCSSGSYKDPYSNLDDVVVEAILTTSVNKQQAKVSIENDNIYLKSGTECKFSLGTCRDSDFGPTFWKTTPTTSSCHDKNKYSVIYSGKANVSTLDNKELYTIETSSKTFSLLNKETIKICGKTLIKTEHPKLFVYVGDDDLEFSPKNIGNNDILTYMNSKFIYTEYYIRRQIENLHHSFLKYLCELERKILINQLSIAIIDSEEFAYRFMGQPGYMAVAAGEVIYVIKCIPIELNVRKTDKCYENLPVKFKLPSHNSSNKEIISKMEFFITPESHILVNYSREVPCSEMIPQCWLVNETWFQYTPDESFAEIPTLLKPSDNITWHFESVQNSLSGIYSQDELNRLHKRINAPLSFKNNLNEMIENRRQHLNSNNNSNFGGVSDDVMYSILIVGFIVLVAILLNLVKHLGSFCGCTKKLPSLNDRAPN